MRSRRVGLGPEDSPSLQITPMINVIIVIVAVFAGGAAFSRMEERLGIKLPAQPFQSQPDTRKNLLLEIRRDALFYLEGKKVGEQDLERVLRREAGAQVTIQPHAQTRHAVVMRALEACSSAGIARVIFASSQ
jgi:biopolymer transport protein ExbD